VWQGTQCILDSHPTDKLLLTNKFYSTRRPLICHLSYCYNQDFLWARFLFLLASGRTWEVPVHGKSWHRIVREVLSVYLRLLDFVRPGQWCHFPASPAFPAAFPPSPNRGCTYSRLPGLVQTLRPHMQVVNKLPGLSKLWSCWFIYMRPTLEDNNGKELW